MKYLFCCLLVVMISTGTKAQREPDMIYMPNIGGVKLFMAGNQMGYPMINLGASMALELHFDDLDGNIKNYNYTYQLCDADWQPADLSPLDYMQGFTQGRLNQYRVSSIAKTKYVHYQALLPNSDCTPTKSGNYLLKVFLNGDTSRLAFTKRLLILKNSVPVGAKITQPFNTQLFRTHQKVQFTIDKTKLDVMSPMQQLKIVVLQNYRWDIASTGMQPVFMRGNLYEYSNEQDCVFPAGREFRWVDLRSFRFQSERVDSANLNKIPFDVYLKPDPARAQMRYLYYQSLGGFFEISATDVNNAWQQGDYANVHFIFVPSNFQPFPDKHVYIVGELTGYRYNDATRLDYNAEKGMYEKTLLLKQGYYSYTYVTKDIKTKNAKPDATDTDGNYWETENNYTILVYYRSLGGRSDELVGAATINSRNFKTGF